jgi:hypothetical protein
MGMDGRLAECTSRKQRGKEFNDARAQRKTNKQTLYSTGWGARELKNSSESVKGTNLASPVAMASTALGTNRRSR